jgi:hypothetical protein
MQPSPMAETLIPVFPRERVFIRKKIVTGPLRGQITGPLRGQPGGWEGGTADTGPAEETRDCISGSNRINPVFA